MWSTASHPKAAIHLPRISALLTARTGRGLLSLQRPRERNERTSFEVFTKQLLCNWNLTLHKGGCFILLLLSFQLSFFLWTTLSLFLLFPSAFIFASLIAHIGFSVIEKTFSALRFFLFKQSTPRPVPSQVPSARVRRRMSALGHLRPLIILPCQRPLRVGSGYRQFSRANGCFRPQSGYTIGMIFSVAYSCFRPKAAVREIRKTPL